ncbi:MAG: carboxypeptidase regulatory-like domain-containing protein [Ginsengibacter sp.]
MRRLFTLLILLLLSGGIAIAQSKVITGIVTDDDGVPVPFTTVTLSSTRNATTADGNCNFSIRMRGIGNLTFTASGLNALSVAPSGNTVSVSLKSNAELKEVMNDFTYKRYP